MTAVIQVDDLIGKPYVRGGRDLVTGIDCYGTLMECHRRIGKTIPEYRTPVSYAEMAELINANKNGWTPIWEKKSSREQIRINDCLPGRTLQICIKGAECHVAFIYKEGWMLHAWQETAGITAERINLWKQRIVGIYEFNG